MPTSSKYTRASLPARPNPSVNATANGMALGPRSTANYHVLRGPSTMPSSARYLKRYLA